VVLEKYNDTLMDIVGDTVGPSGQRLTTFVGIIPSQIFTAMRNTPGIHITVNETVVGDDEAGLVFAGQGTFTGYTPCVFTLADSSPLLTMGAMCDTCRGIKSFVDTVMEMRIGHYHSTMAEEGSWHLPFIEQSDLEGDVFEHSIRGSGDISIQLQEALLVMQKMSVARCARGTRDMWMSGGKVTIDQEMKIFDMLRSNFWKYSPHMSHVAKADNRNNAENQWQSPYLHETFPGWGSYRKMYTLEMIEKQLKEKYND